MSRKRDNSIFLRALLWGLLALAVAACSPHEPLSEPGTGLDQDRFLSGPGAPYADPGLWWTRLGGQPLEQVMERALSKNPGLRAAQAQIEQRLAAEDVSFAALLPSVSLNHTAGRSASRTSGTWVESDSFSLELEASYEIDLFGKNSSSLKAAELEVLAQLEAYKKQLTDLAAQVARAWFDLALIEAQLQLGEETLQSDRANLALIEQGYRLGTAQAAEVLQARQQLVGTQVQQLNLQAQRIVTQQGLHRLTGDYPKAQGLQARLDPALELPPVQPGLPSGLLKRRPDLRAAHLRLYAQDHRIAAALAERFPRLSLSSSIGSSSSELSNLSDPDHAFWNLFANLSLPIFDGGRRRAEVKRQEAILQEQLANYRQTLLGAFGEAEAALSRLGPQEELLALRRKNQVLAREALSLTKAAFVQGVMNWDQVLAAQTQYNTARNAVLQAKRAWVDLRIDLYAALGGDWTGHYLEAAGEHIKDRNSKEP